MGPAVALAAVETFRRTAAAALAKHVARNAVRAAIEQSAGPLAVFGVTARILTLTAEVVRVMLWIRVRYILVVTLTVGLASGGAGVYVCGSQGLAPNDGQAVSKQPKNQTAQNPQPEISKSVIGQPANAELQAKLRAQQLATRKAKASYEIARLTRELAELELEEYEVVVYPRDLAAVEGEIKLSESDLARDRDRSEWAKRMFDKGYVSEATKSSETLNLQKAQFALEQAESKRKILVDYTKSKTLKQLQSAVKKAHIDERYVEQAWQTEKSKEIELRHQLVGETK
jgi:hypothetical protein